MKMYELEINETEAGDIVMEQFAEGEPINKILISKEQIGFIIACLKKFK